MGLDLEYSSGTVIGFCGSVLKHGVEEWGMGDRICYAHFMRESVRDRLDIASPGWVYREQYLPVQHGKKGEILDTVMDTVDFDENHMDVN